MDSLHVLIVGEEPILVLGLWAQFQNWGVDSIEIVTDLETGLEKINSHKQTLLLIVEKSSKKRWLHLISEFSHRTPTSVILLSINPARLKSESKFLGEYTKYVVLSKPPHTEELKEAVENLFEVNLIQETSPEMAGNKPGNGWKQARKWLQESTETRDIQ